MLQDTPQLRDRLTRMAKAKAKMSKDESLFYLIKIMGMKEEEAKNVLAITSNTNKNVIVD